MSGFTITLDALIAIVVCASIVTSSFALISSVELQHDDYAVRYAYDFLNVADKAGVLDEIIERDTSRLRYMVRNIPESICFEIDVYNEQGEPFYHAQTYCQESNKLYIVSRVLHHEDEIYPVTVRVWMNREM